MIRGTRKELRLRPCIVWVCIISVLCVKGERKTEREGEGGRGEKGIERGEKGIEREREGGAERSSESTPRLNTTQST